MAKIDIPLATALRESLQGGYSYKIFKNDIVAALIVSLVALPLSMALAIAVGLPPQHGIYTAIVAGILTPLLGGSMMQVSGPTAAFVVILAPIVAEFGLRGIVIAEIMAGAMLILLAWLRLGRFISFVPYPVTTGFTAGIAVVLGTLSLGDLLGLDVSLLAGSFIDKLSAIFLALPSIKWQEAAIGVTSLLIMFNGKYICRSIPSVVLGIGTGTLITLVLQHSGFEVATIASRFGYNTPEGFVAGIPPFPPGYQWFETGDIFVFPTYLEIRQLLMPAVVIAALAALESLLSATVADGMGRTRHNPNSEIAAIGIANMASGMVGGIPATGAIARTTTNIKSGAKTPLASAMHALFILLYVLALAPLIGYIPMSSLAALLVLTAYNMSHFKQFFRIIHIAPRQDVAVLLACFGLTVFIDMVAGVAVGIMLAAILFIQRISSITEVHIDTSTANDTSLPPNVLVYHISGPLFFGTIERTLDRTAFLRHKIDTLVLDIMHVPLIDMTGLVAIKSLLTGEGLLNKNVIICGKPEIIGKIMQKLGNEAPNVRTAENVDLALDAIKRAA